MSETKEKGIEIILQPTVDLPTARIYSNYVEVRFSPYDFTLRFCDATPIYNMEEVQQNGGVHKIPVVADIAIPFSVMKSLIKALQDQLKQHEKHNDKTSEKKQQ